MANESRDTSGREQMSVVLGYVDTGNEIREHFMGFIELDQFDAKSLSDKLFQFLSELNIPARNCIAQCYDGYVCLIEEKLLAMKLFCLSILGRV